MSFHWPLTKYHFAIPDFRETISAMSSTFDAMLKESRRLLGRRRPDDAWGLAAEATYEATTDRERWQADKIMRSCEAMMAARLTKKANFLADVAKL